jgi:hypothetical protein
MIPCVWIRKSIFFGQSLSTAAICELLTLGYGWRKWKVFSYQIAMIPLYYILAIFTECTNWFGKLEFDMK